MSKFRIKLFSAHSLASTEYAEKAYDLLDNWKFPPECFDKYEPLRQPWSNRDAFIDAWRTESRLAFGQVLILRKKRLRYDADALFQYGRNRKADNKPPYHGFSIYDIKESECRGTKVKALINLADQLFSALTMDYGFICLHEEYESKNIVKNVRHADGSLEPTHVIGMKWPYYLPGLYWINYYGRRYLERGFAADIEKSYPSHVTHVDGGIRFQTSDNPRFFESAEAAKTENHVREALGENWFFDRERDADQFVFPEEHDWIEGSLDELRTPPPG